MGKAAVRGNGFPPDRRRNTVRPVAGGEGRAAARRSAAFL